MERRLIEEAKTPSEAAALQSLFDLRRRLFHRFLLFATLFPLVVLAFSTVFFSSQSISGQTLPLDDDYIQEWDALDQRLIEHIRKYYLYAPAPKEEPYNLLEPNREDWSHKRQSLVVEEVLGGRRNGFFLEAGAYDGETYSNSLRFEKHLNWSGVMVEPDMGNIRTFRSKKRKCSLVRGCIGTAERPQKVQFYGAMDTGTTAGDMSTARYWLTSIWRPVAKFDTWCWPLKSILAAVDAKKVDYFILDVEGHEMPILRANDFSRWDVDVFQVEYMVFMGTHWDKEQSKRRMKETRDYFRKIGYAEHSRIFLDLIFAKKELLKNSPARSMDEPDYSHA